MKPYNLFLDDMRKPKEAYGYTHDLIYKSVKWVIVRSYDEFVSVVSERFVEGYFPSMVSFDHDLADVHYKSANSVKEIKYDSYDEKTGYHCAKWLIELCMNSDLRFPDHRIHSMNFVGKQNIDGVIKSFKKVHG